MSQSTDLELVLKALKQCLETMTADQYLLNLRIAALMGHIDMVVQHVENGTDSAKYVCTRCKHEEPNTNFKSNGLYR